MVTVLLTIAFTTSAIAVAGPLIIAERDFVWELESRRLEVECRSLSDCLPSRR